MIAAPPITAAIPLLPGLAMLAAPDRNGDGRARRIKPTRPCEVTCLLTCAPEPAAQKENATTVAMAVYVGAALAVVALVVAVCCGGALAASSEPASLRLSQRRAWCAAANFTGARSGNGSLAL